MNCFSSRSHSSTRRRISSLPRCCPADRSLNTFPRAWPLGAFAFTHQVILCFSFRSTSVPTHGSVMLPQCRLYVLSLCYLRLPIAIRYTHAVWFPTCLPIFYLIIGLSCNRIPPGVGGHVMFAVNLSPAVPLRSQPEKGRPEPRRHSFAN